ncbi:hypothetical protein ACFYZ3_10005 [Streptomyces sp. NPDC001599]|uniref:hypothetical protein n=1 Tax=Streptomyces sp. NPDC001599 TaxID=3364591 RepID=UPI0036C36D37
MRRGYPVDEAKGHGFIDSQRAGIEVFLGTALARQLRAEKAITGVFDERCMGMYNAVTNRWFLV